ncbi:MAG: hypothetical protein QNJ31_03125 [Candidatus Caenarcaniphilales bacterium]|nr:hypothetical protein [Candidatus Caenarcaniphilales bacterium]
MNITNEQQKEAVSFLELFYNVLFKPNEAKTFIYYMREEDSLKLFFYSLAIVILSSMGLSSFEGNLNLILQSFISWLLIIFSLGLVAWLFRPKNSSFDFGLLFFFGAFTQAPLVFLGLAQLWANSYLPTTIPIFICYLWSTCLWVWAISNSLKVGNLKACLMVLLTFLAPIILFIVFIISIFSILITSVS